jgi:lysophospholipase L1-like esterase
MTLWVVVAGIAALVVAVAAEGGARWWIRHRTRYYVWPPGMRIELRQDPDVFPGVEPCVRVDINADGERGSDVRADEPGLFRILVGGGSAVECLALDQPTSWPGALERRLNAPDALARLGARRVHVGSIGRSGVGSEDLDAILERVLPQYERLDAILIMVAASDVYHWLEDGAPAGRPPTPIPAEALFSCHPGQSFGWRPGATATAEVVRRLRRTWLRPVEVKEQAGSWVPAARRMRAEAKEMRSAVPDPTALLDNFESHLRRLVRRAATCADRVLVLRQPWFEKDYTKEEAARFWHGGMGKAWRQTITVFYSHEVINGLLGLVDARVAQVARDLGVQQLCLRPTLAPDLQNYYDHDHYTPAGAAIVARAVAGALLPPRPSKDEGFEPLFDAAGVS